MIRHKNEWPQTENAVRYKLFSEIALELVHDDSWESYKCHALSTVRKFLELLNTSKSVVTRVVPKATLNPIIEEVSEAIDKDPIIKILLEKAGFDKIQFELRESDSVEEMNSTISLMLDLVARYYKSECEKQIQQICLKKGSKRTLQTITKVYIADLINSGYSKKYVADSVLEIFYENKIGRSSKGLLTRFFAKFQERKRAKKFDVLICGKRAVIQYMAEMFGLASVADIHELPNAPFEGVPNNFGEGEQKTILVVAGISADDPYTAAKLAHSLVGIARSLLYLHPGKLKMNVDDAAYSLETRSRKGKQVSLKGLFEPRRNLNSRRIRRP